MVKQKIWKEWRCIPSVFDEFWQLKLSVFYSGITLRNGEWHTDKSVSGGLPLGTLVFKNKEDAMRTVQKLVVKEYKKISKVMRDKIKKAG